MATKKYPGSSNLLEIFNKIKSTFADKSHTHGNITADGKVGTEADKLLTTGTDGIITTKSQSDLADLLNIVSTQGTPTTLPASGWTNKSITVSVAGVSASSNIIVSPDPTCFSDYTSSVIHCTGQTTGYLTFVCATTPSTDIVVNVLVVGDTTENTGNIFIKGTYSTLELLKSSVENPSQGDFYHVGTTAPYDLYMYDTSVSDWLYQGHIAYLPTTSTALPPSGTALTANTIYHVTNAVGTYAFTPPAEGWAHGYFATYSTASVSFSGQFVGAAPSIVANAAYEFDVFDGIWAVQEVVNA